jgi:hypothetical protein
MANKFFGATSLTGGGTGAMDAIDGSALIDGDICDVTIAATDIVQRYTLSAASGAAESSPTIISPDTNAGNKRWLLTRVVTKDGITLYDGTNVGHVQFDTNELELYNERHSGVVKLMVEDAAGNKETAVKATGAGAVELYYDNAKKLETVTGGVTVSGTLTATTVAGALNSYVDRGDPAGYDKVVGDLTTDGTWRDLDLSAVVPSGAVAVHICCNIIDDAAGSVFLIRKNGNTNSYNTLSQATQAANVTVYFDGIVKCDANRVVEYVASNTAWTGINITIRGWII